MYKWIHHSVRSNIWKSVFLLISFPALLRGVLLLVFYVMWHSEQADITWWDALYVTNDIFLWLWPLILIWWVISFFFQRQIIFSFAGAKPVTRKEYPEIYNIVENLCISRWLPTPKIGIMEDDSLNAFALGWHPKNSWIVFSRWLLRTLNKAEIEAVAWHELAHIINKDSLLMVVIVVFIGIIGTLWQILIRMWSSRWNGGKWNVLPLIGLILIVLWYVVYPLIRLALSRRREFLADAGSVMLTKDKFAMISALRKISQKPDIAAIQKDTVAALCIANPLASSRNFLGNLLSTHPPIEDRIRALESY